MQTEQDVLAMYELVSQRVQATQDHVQDCERKYSMGLITEQTLAYATETLASQTSQQYTLAWVLWGSRESTTK